MKDGIPRKLYILAAGACLAFIVYATLCSISNRPFFWSSHEPHSVAAVERFVAYLLFGFLTRLAFPVRYSVVLVLGSAFILELLQNLIPGRDPLLRDAAVKAIGGVIGILLAHHASRTRSPSRPS